MNMKKLLLLGCAVLCITGQMQDVFSKAEQDVSQRKFFIPTKSFSPTRSNVAAWTMLVYMAADNSLASFASYNIKDMSAGLASTDGTNILVQWDQPNNNITWRYKVTPGGTVDVGSLNSEMGYNPANELVASMKWATQNYPANNYALVLWNHGSGIE